MQVSSSEKKSKGYIHELEIEAYQPKIFLHLAVLTRRFCTQEHNACYSYMLHLSLQLRVPTVRKLLQQVTVERC